MPFCMMDIHVVMREHVRGHDPVWIGCGFRVIIGAGACTVELPAILICSY